MNLVYSKRKECLNPYSTGSNSNVLWCGTTEVSSAVLILILLEVTQIRANSWCQCGISVIKSLNPYSTGSNSNTLIINNLFFTLCFVYFS